VNIRTVPPHSAPTQAPRAHHLLLCFEPDGGVSFYPRTDDPPEFAQRHGAIGHGPMTTIAEGLRLLAGHGGGVEARLLGEAGP
jgi:hypothetical protein